MSFAKRLALELFLIILALGLLETLLGPYLGFIRPAKGSGVIPIGLLVYTMIRYGFYRTGQKS